MVKPKFMQIKETEKDTRYVLLQCDDLYLSVLLMPLTLYDNLSDIVIKEDVDYFWGLRSNELSAEQYEVVRDNLFKHFGKKVTISNTNYIFWLLGSIPQELLPYIKALK